jgi:parallel beta-helix repeat protein
LTRLLINRRAFVAMTAAMFARPAFALPGGRVFHVSPQGSDSSTGTFAEPFATISRVFSAVPDLGAGDVVSVMPGTYNEQVTVTAGGDPSSDLVIKSVVPHEARIRSPADTYSAVNIVRSHVTMEGFDVQAGGGGHAIEATFIDGDNRNEGPHHITIRNNVCHDSAGSGISLAYGDFYLIEGNTCFNNCATNEYQGSGIGPPGIRNIVRGNVCHDNMAILLPGDVPHSDGNGIIIDDLKNSQSGHPAGSYRYFTLVENNLSYRNGGKGVHVFLSENVAVRNNTCCFNNRDPKNPASWRGELSNVDSNNVVWVNNIAVADPAVNKANAAILDAAAKGRNIGVSWISNLTFDGRQGNRSVTKDPAAPKLDGKGNLLGVDPQFVLAAADAARPDFRLKQGSPAIDAGTAEFGVPRSDLSGAPRVHGERPDLGAFEFKEG